MIEPKLCIDRGDIQPLIQPLIDLEQRFRAEGNAAEYVIVHTMKDILITQGQPTVLFAFYVNRLRNALLDPSQEGDGLPQCRAVEYELADLLKGQAETLKHLQETYHQARVDWDRWEREEFERLKKKFEPQGEA